MEKQILSIMEGLNIITKALEDMISSEFAEVKSNKDVTAKKEVEKEVVKETKKEVKKEGTELKDDTKIKDLTYNELKSTCKQLGLSAKGTKKELIARIEELKDEVEEVVDEAEKIKEEEETKEEVLEVAEDDIEDVEEDEGDVDVADILSELTVKELKSVAKKLNVKVPIKITKEKLINRIIDKEGLVDTLEELGFIAEVEEVEEETETNEDEVYAEIDGMSDEELIELLDSIGKSTKGKHQALVAKVISAIEEGELELADEEEENVEEGNEVEYEGTKKRLSAIEELDQELRESYNAEEITDKEIKKFLDEINHGRFDLSDLEDNLENYIQIKCNLIDDDGEQNELGQAYFVGDDVYCCGHKIKDVDGTLYCEHCGTEWEI